MFKGVGTSTTGHRHLAIVTRVDGVVSAAANQCVAALQ